jgi:hypothetical protein
MPIKLLDATQCVCTIEQLYVLLHWKTRGKRICVSLLYCFCICLVMITELLSCNPHYIESVRQTLQIKYTDRVKWKEKMNGCSNIIYCGRYVEICSPFT